MERLLNLSTSSILYLFVKSVNRLGAILSGAPEMRKMPYKTCMMLLYVEIITACEAHPAEIALPVFK
jgi:hypothetical protein